MKGSHNTVRPSEAHIVLIHGAWQGSWAFAAWQPFLERAGWQVHAVDLPGNGARADETEAPTLQGYTDHVTRLLERLDAPAIVVGHSGGGMTASQVAEAMPERVRALVYLAGMMLPNGMRFADVVAACEQADPGADYRGIGPYLVWNADHSRSGVPPEAALALFLHDCDERTAREGALKLCSQAESGRAMYNQLTPERYGSVPRIYVECTQDRSVVLPVQRRMQQLSPGATRLSIDCGHVPQIACPQMLSDRLLPLLKALPIQRGGAAAGIDTADFINQYLGGINKQVQHPPGKVPR